MNEFRLSVFNRNILSLFLLALFILTIGTGCLLDITGVNQAEAELADIPVVTPVPTKEKPSPTPVPVQSRADAMVIATEVAINRANSTPTPPPPTLGPNTAPDSPYPLLEDGANFKEITGGLWYTSEKSAAEIQEFYIDRMTYFRWDDYELGTAGEGYSEIQFEKNYERVQVNIWENPSWGHTSIIIFETEPALQALRELPTTSFDQRWLVMGPPEEFEEFEPEPEAKLPYPTAYETEMPLPQVGLFYLVRMLDSGWQLLPTERLAPYGYDLQFFTDDDQVVVLLQDNGTGTTVSLFDPNAQQIEE